MRAASMAALMLLAHVYGTEIEARSVKAFLE